MKDLEWFAIAMKELQFCIHRIWYSAPFDRDESKQKKLETPKAHLWIQRECQEQRGHKLASTRKVVNLNTRILDLRRQRRKSPDE